ncbi:MAG TPA: hypothetical protein V6C58_02480, partial [Allocoleopsis sp.]
MVLESILSPENAENKPALMLILGAVYSSLAIFLSYFIFEAYSSIFMIFLTTLAATPTIYKIMKTEEEKDLTDVEETALLKEHAKALKAFMYLFFGATLAFALWFVVLPQDMTNTLYHSQSSTISSINARVVDNTLNQESLNSANFVTGNVSNPGAVFTKIFFNNIKVLLFCILFSFIYGAGA